MGSITIALADDHQVVREGLRALLEQQPGLTVVGEASDGLEAVQLVERLKPAVLVTDLMLPGLNGLEVTRRIKDRKETSRTNVVILSMYADEAYVLDALKNGALGYVLKCSSTAELVQAIREVSAGRRYLSAPVSEKAAGTYLKQAKAARLDIYETLTAREREVLQLAAEGRTSAQIAARLFISPRTVESHRANLMRKLNLKRHSDLVRYALRRGIVPLDE